MVAQTAPRLTGLPAWKALQEHYLRLRQVHLRQLFAGDEQRGERLAVETEGLYFDYSKNRINDETLFLLFELAEQSGLSMAIEAMFRGARINITEQRPVLHTALRAAGRAAERVGSGPPLLLDGVDITAQVRTVLDRMTAFALRIRGGEWTGYTGKPVRNIVNIGIGGSDLGPVMAWEALRFYSRRDLTFRFVSNIDGTDFREKTRDLNPEETLFIICSKTMTTLETLTNALTARAWIQDSLGDPSAVSRHFAAVTAGPRKAVQFGIDPACVFEFWDWVGGRFSLDSAIGLSTLIAIGPDNFQSMLEGFHRMDEHFRYTPFQHNIPVLMGLLAVWYADFFNSQAAAVIPYAQYLQRFPAYLQQLLMESNGKSVTRTGDRVDYPTAPVIWGEPGTNGQHSFFQLLHQGTGLIPCDFIGFIHPLNPPEFQHDLLMAALFAQAEALAFGVTADELRAENVPERLIPHRVMAGNHPSSLLLLDRLTPAALGKLVAIYEHSTFVQGVIWGINSFDQWGVELGKSRARRIIDEFKNSAPQEGHDSSTSTLIRRYLDNRREPFTGSDR